MIYKGQGAGGMIEAHHGTVFWGDLPYVTSFYTFRNMNYKLDGSKLLLAIDRARIVDISVDDILTVDGFDGVQYKWTDHDRDFVENNPDAEIFLEIEKAKTEGYKATGIILK